MEIIVLVLSIFSIFLFGYVLRNRKICIDYNKKTDVLWEVYETIKKEHEYQEYQNGGMSWCAGVPTRQIATELCQRPAVDIVNRYVKKEKTKKKKQEIQGVPEMVPINNNTIHNFEIQHVKDNLNSIWKESNVKSNEYQKKWKKENRDRQKKYMQDYYQKNKKQIILRSKLYYMKKKQNAMQTMSK